MQEERRKIDRVNYQCKAVIVECDTLEKTEAEVINFSPIGIGLTVSGDTKDILHKDVIVVTDTVIMYAEVIRRDKQADGTFVVGVSGKRFTNDVMQYIFERITPEH